MTDNSLLLCDRRSSKNRASKVDKPEEIGEYYIRRDVADIGIEGYRDGAPESSLHNEDYG